MALVGVGKRIDEGSTYYREEESTKKKADRKDIKGKRLKHAHVRHWQPLP